MSKYLLKPHYGNKSTTIFLPCNACGMRIDIRVCEVRCHGRKQCKLFHQTINKIDKSMTKDGVDVINLSERRKKKCESSTYTNCSKNTPKKKSSPSKARATSVKKKRASKSVKPKKTVSKSPAVRSTKRTTRQTRRKLSELSAHDALNLITSSETTKNAKSIVESLDTLDQFPSTILAKNKNLTTGKTLT